MNKSTKDIAAIVIMLILIIVLLGVGPFLIIWSINTLFLTQITFNFWTWLATAYLQLVTFGGIIANLSAIKNKL